MIEHQSLFHISKMYWHISKVGYFLHKHTGCLNVEGCEILNYPPTTSIENSTSFCSRCKALQVFYLHEQFLKDMYITHIAFRLGYDGFQQEYADVKDLCKKELKPHSVLHSEILLMIINARLVRGYNLWIANENLNDSFAVVSSDYVSALEQNTAGIIWRYNQDIKIEHNRDPRGPSIKLFFSSGVNNSFAGSDGGYGLGVFYTEKEERFALREFKKEVVEYAKYKSSEYAQLSDL